MSEFDEPIALAHRILDGVGPDYDDDFAMLARQFLRAVEARDIYREAIRKHRDYRGDDRCFLDDGELYALLPEGDTRPASDTAVTIENCQRFIAARQQGREYVSPERELERLRVLVAELLAALKLALDYEKGGELSPGALAREVIYEIAIANAERGA